MQPNNSTFKHIQGAGVYHYLKVVSDITLQKNSTAWHLVLPKALDGYNVVAVYNLCDAATFLKTILGSY